MAKKRRPQITVTPSSGNIFADLGLKNPERELARDRRPVSDNET